MTPLLPVPSGNDGHKTRGSYSARSPTGSGVSWSRSLVPGLQSPLVWFPLRPPPRQAGGSSKRWGWQEGCRRSCRSRRPARTTAGPQAWSVAEWGRRRCPPNGKGWRNVTMPVVPQGTSALGPRDIWAVGPVTRASAKAVDAIANWNGTSWRSVRFPRLRLGTGVSIVNPQVVALSRNNVWVASSLGKGMGIFPGALLLHWSGSGWRHVGTPFPTEQVGPLTQDGQAASSFPQLAHQRACQRTSTITATERGRGPGSRPFQPAQRR
jgi:hypothetical protein